ncbi:helix-turn-helix domain-containing protein [Streptomyces sp. NPDC048156]|uniref:helix-turn-helix domain-containing protein n=1 Tax=Streptomyces sp. NPDC048156 TaxID=3365502 RepID=UPI00372158D4
MTSDAADTPAPTDRTDMDITALLALPPGAAPTSPDRPAPAAVTSIRAERRASARLRQDQRDTQPSRHEDTARPVIDSAGEDSNGGDVGRLFTAEQAAQVLQVPPSWLRKKAAADAIPHTRVGRHLRFSARDLRRLIADGQRGPTDAPNG